MGDHVGNLKNEIFLELLEKGIDSEILTSVINSLNTAEEIYEKIEEITGTKIENKQHIFNIKKDKKKKKKKKKSSDDLLKQISSAESKDDNKTLSTNPNVDNLLENEDEKSKDKMEKRKEENEKSPKFEEKSPLIEDESSDSISDDDDGKKQKKKKKKKKEAEEIEARLKKVAHPMIIPQTSLPLKNFYHKVYDDYANRHPNSSNFKTPYRANANSVNFLLAKTAKSPTKFSQIVNIIPQSHQISNPTMIPEILFKKNLEGNTPTDSDKSNQITEKVIEKVVELQPQVKNTKINTIFKLLEFAEEQIKKIGLTSKDLLCIEPSVRFSAEIFTNSINDLNY